MTHTVRALRFLARLSWRNDRRRLLLGGGLLMAGTLCSPLVAVVCRAFVDSLSSPDGILVTVLAVCLVTGLVGQLMLGHFAHLWYFELGDADEVVLSQDLAAIVTDMRLEEVEDPRTADRIELIRKDAIRVRATVGAGLLLAASCVQLVMTAVLLGTVSVVLLVLPLAAAVPVFLTDWAERSLRTAQQSATPARRTLAHLHELVSSPAHQKEIRLGGAAAHLGRIHAETHDELQHSMNRAHSGTAVRSILGQGPFALTFAAAMAVLVALVSHGRAGVGDVVMTILLAPQVSNQVTTLLRSLSTVGAAALGLGHFEELRDTAAESPASGPRDRHQPPEQLSSGMRLENLGYSYRGSRAPVLDGLSITVPAGTSVAVVGENGAGKSTLVKLLHGLYRPTSGRILLDGTDLTEITPDGYFALTAALFQDFEHFDLRLMESIGIGDVPYMHSEERVHEAIGRARAESVLQRIGGLDEFVGHGYTSGTDLSGGQWQSLAFARALMKRRPLVLSLDEPGHSLDPEAEERMHDAYEATARAFARASGAITFYVTHRLANVRSADFVLVLRDGKAEAFGTHDELVTGNDYYAELFQLQARSYR
ncbi:ATP-binding cassette domain-containing protein [Streptomyces microflavus]|uniref:ATP-binding cassette domain-containing protein n=1 Tax=Streptomyces microflavus TaxID=1919 RepID=UPI0036577BE1